MKTVFVYSGKCLTNLHVGNGDTTYGLIDNEVSRDVVLNVPNIPGSGVKGAIREFVRDEGKLEKDKIDIIFGPESKEARGKQGSYKFFSAILYKYPIQLKGEESTEGKAYELRSPQGVKEYVADLLGSLGVAGINVEHPNEHKPFSFSDVDLPIVARNNLETAGGNLWYEEYVPHQSEFLFIVISDSKKDELALDGEVIQFGANASIGQGLIRLTRLV